jgi:hypothetical protein
MPRPEGKPPTEGGKVMQELTEYVNNASKNKTLNREEILETQVLFLINKLEEIQNRLNEISYADN